MARAVTVPITPSVLDWAIEESGFTVDEVAERLKVTAAEVRAWTHGKDRPSLSKFGELAHMLRRPSAAFLLPSPPEAHEVQIEFRHAPGAARRSLQFQERLRIREAQRLRDVLSWISSELGDPAPTLPTYSVDDDPDVAGEAVRSLLGVDIEAQSAWKSDVDGAKAWRAAVENCGVAVFFLAMDGDAARGFSIWDERMPVIVVNTHWNAAARSFTTLHELGHLVTRTNSLCAAPNAQAPRGIERWCERFAASVLMPREAVKCVAAVAGRGLRCASAIARRFRVSHRAAVIRLIDLGLATWDLYKKVPSAADHKGRSGGGGGVPRTRPLVRVAEFGQRATRTVLRGLQREIIGTTDAMRYLDVTALNLDDLAQLVL